MGWISSLASELGAAYGTFQRSLAKARSKRPGFLTAWADSERWNGGDWTERNAQERAVSNSWYYAAIGAFLDEIIQAELQVVEHRPGAEPVELPTFPFLQLVRRPNPFMGRAFLWEFSYWWFRLDGNFYWYIACDPTGRIPLELWPIPARDCRPMPGDKDRFIDYYEYIVNGIIYQIPSEYIAHVRRPNPFNIFDGLSDLRAAMLPVDSDTAMARWNGSFFGRDNVMPSAIINLSSGDPSAPIDPADAEALKSDLRSEYQAFKRKTAITTAYDVSVNPIGWNAKDMDFIQGRGFTKEEIFAITRMHAGRFDPNATEANAVVAERVIKGAAWGDLTRIAEQLTVDLIIPYYGPQYEACFKDIRPGDRQMELNELDRAKGALTVNEVRQKYFQEKPLEDERGDKLYGESSAPAPSPFPFNLAQQQPAQTPAPSALEYGQPDTDEALVADMAMADLRRWREKSLKALKRGKAVSPSFASDYIPAEVARPMTTLLKAATTPEQVRLIFEHGQQALKDSSFRPWSTFENQLLSAVAAFLSTQASKLISRVRERGPNAVDDDAFWIEQEGLMVNEVEPVLAGLASFAVEKVRQATPSEIGIDWDLANQNAAEWARQHAAEMIGQVTETTRERIRNATAEWIDASEVLDDLINRIDEIVDSPARAQVIATTEATNVYAEANNQAWGNAGYARAVFTPGAHVNCRCYIQPARLSDGSKAIVWYTARDELVCVDPIATPWGEVDGCRGLHLVVVSDGPMLGQKLR